jgi:DNA-binding SARP family transcriptional activator
MPSPHKTDSDSTLLRLSFELRQLTRQVRDPETSERPLVRGLALLLSGDLVAAAQELLGADSGQISAQTTPWEALALRLVSRLVDLLIQPQDVSAGQVEEIMLSADFEGWPWLSRLARSLQTAMLLAAAPERWRISAAAELLDDLERRQDHWTLGLSSLAIGAAYAGIDQSSLATRTLRQAEDVAAELGAPVLGAWARVLRSSVAVREGELGGEQEAASAVRAAAALGLRHADDVLQAVTRQDQVSALRQPQGASSLAQGALSSPGASTTLRCLGGFTLTAGGVDLPWRELRPRVRALLMLLAMNHGRHMHRERIVDTLWPDATLASGIRSLQVAVSSIRQCLSAGGITEDALHRHGDAYALQLPSVVDQLADFERLARAAVRAQRSEALRLRLSALDLYAGDLLPEMGPAEWVVEERARLRLLAAEVASEAARSALAADDLRTALEAARRSVALDPYHDPSWELVVEICERAGDHSAAAVARREQARIWVDLGLVIPGPDHAGRVVGRS